ncbi:hypothetical protein TRAPUB_6050 [Trametes pubescens]|uniref:Uncharacterized protein n=1 Tax=Trametes pubescens TaxID=154538 RepID=A0A1M2V709_TRAPU|nr:hypothetical protein TRAPUB_6050 [Trametes pubescens]
MLTFSKAVICAVLLAKYASAAPAGASSGVASSAAASASSAASSAVFASASSAVSSVFASASTAVASSDLSSSTIATATSSFSAEPASVTVPFASDDPNGILWSEDSTIDPQAIRNTLGATIMGPQNIPIALQNPDLLAPPSTDEGSV